MPERLITAVEATPDVHWQVPEDFQGIIAYNPRHDIQDYLNLKRLNGKIDPVLFAQGQIRIDNRTRRQLEKALGERFGVEKSLVSYYIQDGTLKSPDYNEPVLKRYKKGQLFLLENGSLETEREAAEVRGIAAVERIFANKPPESNQSVVIISPRGRGEGTLYNDNYFDVYKKKEDGAIEMTRYHSTHTYVGFFQAAKEANPHFPHPTDETGLNAAYFLDKPIVTALPEEKILEVFALDHEAQLQRENQQIIDTCTPFITAYINTLSENPLEIEQIKMNINTIFNVADLEKKRQDQAKRFGSTNTTKKLHPVVPKDPNPAAIMQTIEIYGRQPARSSAHGCPGGQRGFSVNQPTELRAFARSIGATSVIDFARFAQLTEDEDHSDFNCPDCGHLIKYGAGIKECPGCGKKATCSVT